MTLLTFLRRLSYGLGMRTIALPILSTLLGLLQSRAFLHFEILALRQQLSMVNQTPRKRLRFHWRQWLFWVWLYCLWPGHCRSSNRIPWCAGIATAEVVHFKVTEHPTAQWTAQQMIEAFPWIPAPQYLLRDRDKTYGASFRHRVHSLAMKEILTAPRSPWQKELISYYTSTVLSDTNGSFSCLRVRCH